MRVTAYTLRFSKRLRARGHKGSAEEGKTLKSEDGPLSPEELQDAETYWLKKSQKTLRNRLSKGEFRNPSPYVNQEGVWRVGGRTDKAQFSFVRDQTSCITSRRSSDIMSLRPACSSVGTPRSGNADSGKNKNKVLDRSSSRPGEIK